MTERDQSLRASLLPLVKRMHASVEDIRRSEFSREFASLADLIQKWADEFDEALNADIYTD